MTMANQRLRVLILDGGRQALPFMRSLKRKGHHVSIVCARRLCEAFFSRYADRRLLWPDYFVDPAGFERQMVDYIRRHRPDYFAYYFLICVICTICG